MGVSQSIDDVLDASCMHTSKKADLRNDIWRPYFWPRDGNENGWFKARYLASIFLALRQQWKRPIRGNILGQYFWPLDGNEKGQFKARYLASIFLALRRQWKRPFPGKISYVRISGLMTAMKMADSRPDIWRPYFWPLGGNEKGWIESRNLASVFLASKWPWKLPIRGKKSGVHISGLDGNENGLFDARYLGSIFLASRQQWSQISGIHISGLVLAMKMADSRPDIWHPWFEAVHILASRRQWKWLIRGHRHQHQHRRQ